MEPVIGKNARITLDGKDLIRDFIDNRAGRFAESMVYSMWIKFKPRTRQEKRAQMTAFFRLRKPAIFKKKPSCSPVDYRRKAVKLVRRFGRSPFDLSDAFYFLMAKSIEDALEKGVSLFKPN